MHHQNRKSKNRPHVSKKNEEKINFSQTYKPQPPKKYGVLFFDQFQSVIEKSTEIVEQAKSFDQLNIVVKAEGNMDDQEILQIDKKVKLFAGEAWWLIHQRRSEDGWYDHPR